MSLRRLLSLSTAVGFLVLAASCGQVKVVGDRSTSATNDDVDELQTEVAGLRQTQAVQATALAEQGAQVTRLSGFVSYLATVVPRATRTIQPPTKTPFVPIEGSVLLEGGRCCAGGIAGQPLTLHAELQARSQMGDVVEMRTRIGLAAATLADMAGRAWEPFSRQVTFEVSPGVNWTGYFVSAQFRDSQGTESDVFWDEISVEGEPPGGTTTP